MNTTTLEAPLSPDRSVPLLVATDRVDARGRAAARGIARQSQVDRERAAQRLLLLMVPRR